MPEPRIVIIGGGIVGISTALELLRFGVEDVTVLEAAYPGEGSTGRSVGMVETQYFELADVEVRAFGQAWFTSLRREHGLNFVRGGYLRMARDQRDVERFSGSAAVQAECGITDSEVLTPAEIRRRWPRIAVDDRAGGLFGPSDGFVDGYECCGVLARLVRDAGGRVVSAAPVRAVDSKATGGRTLVTDKGQFDAEVVVNAAGGWAGEVGEMLDASVPLAPQLHGAVTVELDAPMTPPLPFVMDYVPGSGTDGVYFRSERANQLIAGLHTEEAIHEVVDPDTNSGAVSQDFVERVTMLMAERLNDCADLAIGRSWTGIYPMSPDHRPIVGQHPTAPDVVCAVGAGGSGIQLSPAMARIAAGTVVGAPSGFTHDPDWSPDRIGALSEARGAR